VRWTSLFICLVTLLSCSHDNKSTSTENVNSNTSNYFSLKDQSGEYILKRDILIKNSTVLTRQSIFVSGQEDRPLEKTVTKSKYGSSKNRKNLVRPLASQHSIWFEKNKYFSQFKLNIKNRSFDVLMESPERKWNGKESLKFPKAKIFCWFSQLPECLHKVGILAKKPKIAVSFYIVWGGYPYYSEQYNGVSGRAFSRASVKIDAQTEGRNVFVVSVDNQNIFYHFNSNLEFEKMFWITQGISMMRLEN